MDDVRIRIDEIYVPTARRSKLNAETVAALADSILEEGMKIPINVRKDGARYVLVEGLHRLEACKALGEEEITAIIVRAKQH
ncbi:MAG: ParB N-terminal domain-containing protein [Kiloniellales bacterium]